MRKWYQDAKKYLKPRDPRNFGSNLHCAQSQKRFTQSTVGYIRKVQESRAIDAEYN